MGRYSVRPLAFAMLVVGSASPAFAQGSSVYTQSACVSARGGAAVAAPCEDASSVYYNPAALALTPSAISAGFTAIYNEGTFTYDAGAEVTRDAATPLVPQAYVSYRFGMDQRWAAGLGFWAPYGLGIEWPEDFEGRFISQKTQLRGIYLQPTVSYQITPGQTRHRRGPSDRVGRDRAEPAPGCAMVLAIDAFSFLPLGTDIARRKLEGSGTGFGGQSESTTGERPAVHRRPLHALGEHGPGGHGGLHPLSNPDVSCRSPGRDGAAGRGAGQPVPGGRRVRGPGRDREPGVPGAGGAGVRFGATPQLAIMADYQWTGGAASTRSPARSRTRRAGDLTLQLDYNDAHTFRLGTEFAASPGAGAAGRVHLQHGRHAPTRR
jgi:long-chain fatty acid transport protein